MFQIRRMCFSNWSTIHKVIIKVRHSCVIKNWQINCNIYKILKRFPINTQCTKGAHYFHRVVVNIQWRRQDLLRGS